MKDEKVGKTRNVCIEWDVTVVALGVQVSFHEALVLHSKDCE